MEKIPPTPWPSEYPGTTCPSRHPPRYLLVIPYIADTQRVRLETPHGTLPVIRCIEYTSTCPTRHPTRYPTCGIMFLDLQTIWLLAHHLPPRAPKMQGFHCYINKGERSPVRSTAKHDPKRLSCRRFVVPPSFSDFVFST